MARKILCGIYCTSNSKYFYIGQSRDIYKRWTAHKRRLKTNKHYNKFFQRVYNKYNASDPFIGSVVRLCSREELTNEEILMLRKYTFLYSNKTSLNLVEPCTDWSEESIKKFKETRTGKKHSEETKKKISERQKGKKVKSIQVKIVQISLEGELIKIWDSIKEAQEILGFKINLHRDTCGGFQFQRYKEYIDSPKEKYTKSNKIPVKQYTLEGELIKEWNSLSEAAKELKINPGNISNVIRGYQKTSGGYIWKS